MKKNVLQLSVIIAAGIFFTACEDNEVKIAAPLISDLEVGASDSHIGYIGSDLHLEAEVVAEGKIDIISVEIHKEDGSGDEIEVSYDDYAGLLNTTFHQHVDIPEGTAAGEYHLHITVIDMEGNSTSVEEELSLEVSTDIEGPSISVTDVPTENAEFSTGQSITISGQIADQAALGGLVVALVREDDTEVSTETVIIMLLNYFEDTTEFNFEATIDAGAEYDKNTTPELIEGENAWQSGAYYILVRAWDAVGNITESQQYPVQIIL